MLVQLEGGGAKIKTIYVSVIALSWEGFQRVSASCLRMLNPFLAHQSQKPKSATVVTLTGVFCKLFIFFTSSLEPLN